MAKKSPIRSISPAPITPARRRFPDDGQLSVMNVGATQPEPIPFPAARAITTARCPKCRAKLIGAVCMSWSCKREGGAQ